MPRKIPLYPPFSKGDVRAPMVKYPATFIIASFSAGAAPADFFVTIHAKFGYNTVQERQEMATGIIRKEDMHLAPTPTD
jgi:hypothetical protein